MRATFINSETAPAQPRAHECKYFIQTEFLLEDRMPFRGGNNYGTANLRVSDKENRERVRKWLDKPLGGLPQKCRTVHRLCARCWQR